MKSLSARFFFFVGLFLAFSSASSFAEEPGPSQILERLTMLSKELRTQLTTQQADLTESRTKLQDSQAALNKAQAELTELRARYSTLQTQSAELERALSELSAGIEIARQYSTKLTDSWESYKKDMGKALEAEKTARKRAETSARVWKYLFIGTAAVGGGFAIWHGLK